MVVGWVGEVEGVNNFIVYYYRNFGVVASPVLYPGGHRIEVVKGSPRLHKGFERSVVGGSHVVDPGHCLKYGRDRLVFHFGLVKGLKG